MGLVLGAKKSTPMRWIFPACCAWANEQSAKSAVLRVRAITFLFISLFLLSLVPRHSTLSHLITLSALASTLGGIVRPICLAAFRFIKNSNLMGCSTGRSAGFLPFRILSTYVGTRRYKSVKLTP